jgi:hypothetical protein
LIQRGHRNKHLAAFRQFDKIIFLIEAFGFFIRRILPGFAAAA